MNCDGQIPGERRQLLFLEIRRFFGPKFVQKQPNLEALED